MSARLEVEAKLSAGVSLRHLFKNSDICLAAHLLPIVYVYYPTFCSRSLPSISPGRWVPLLHPPLHIRPLPNDIHWEVGVCVFMATAAFPTSFIASSSAARTGVYRHLDAASKVFGHQLKIVAGVRWVLVRLGQPVPLRALGVQVEGVGAVRGFAASPANRHDGRAAFGL